ncbi:MAG: hypothetical protein IMZ53_14420, partial [Thermoplasmata archaeon]|nr:hypothetical protein [Thermoplasmata archaeon]
MSKTVGLFKIFLGSDFNYMTRINENPPNILITDIAKTVLKVYGYLFMQSLARITGSGNRDRTSSGAILDVETTTCYLPGTERDYGEVYYDSEIGVDVTVDHIICDNAVLATVGLGVYGDRARGMTHMPLYRTKDIGAGGSSSGLTGVGNRRDQPVWDADIPLCKALKVDSSSTPGSLVISGSSNKWVRGDIGSRCIVVSAAGSVGIGRITGFTSENAVTITAYATYTIPTSTECYACIGGYRVMKASSATYSGISYNWNMITPDATAKNGVFSYNDIGRIIYVSDGSIRHIKQIISVGGVLCAIVEEIGTMSELFGNIVSTLDFSNLCIAIQNDTNSASVLAYNRAWNDTIPDSPQADGRVSLQDRIDYGTDLYIPRRMFRPMPNGDTGIIDNGFLVVAERDKGEYNYCQTGDKPYCIGQYKYPEQRREVVGAISHITGYPFMALVTMYDKTGIITLSSSQNIGRTEIGENIFQLPELSVVDDKHGVIAWKTITYKNSNLIFALTSDSAFRYFSGTAWSKEDLAYVNGLDAVSKEYLRKIDHNNIKGAVYGMNGGIKIWFQMLVGGVLTDMCLRFSTETGEGYGWSLITGTDWVFPIDEQGVFSILDDNDIQRVLVIDKNDYQIYEIDTFDRSTVVKAPVLDKEDVEDTEITWKRRGVEHIASIGSEQKRLIHEMSYENIEPSDKANRGETGYTATGQRNAQELTLKTFFDGERTDESARAEDFPESGEIVFTGRKKEANKILMELSGTAGELNLTGMTDVFLIEERAPTRDRRV